MTANDDIPVMVLITINLRFFQLSHHNKQNRMTLCSDVSLVTSGPAYCVLLSESEIKQLAKSCIDLSFHHIPSHHYIRHASIQ